MEKLRNKSGFDKGDKFVYFSKYGGITYGVVNDIIEVQTLIGSGVWVYKYFINRIYDSKEIEPIARIVDDEEKKNLNKIKKSLEIQGKT